MVRDRDKAVRLNPAFVLAALHALPPLRETIGMLGMFKRKTNRLDFGHLRASAPRFYGQPDLLLNDHIANSKRTLIIDALGWSNDTNALPLFGPASGINISELLSAALRAAAQLGIPSVEHWVF